MSAEAATISNEPQAFITPRLLRWARNRSQMSIEALAWKLRVGAEQIRAWETGGSDERPSFAQAQKLARILRVPFGYLFLSKPPSEKPPIPDLRTVGNAPHKPLSPDFIEVLNDALRKQEWYKEFRKIEGEERLSFIGRYDLNTNEDIVATDIASTIGISELRDEVRDWEGFLSQLIDRCESQNILVLRNSVVKNETNRPLSVQEFRGFVITDDLAPLIFLNGSDAKAAQIFTLVHELAHLWLGKSGILNPILVSKQSSIEIEQHCNRIAAQVLVPRDLFDLYWALNLRVETNLARLSKRFRVSYLVILKRAYDLKRIPWNDYVRLYRLYERRYAKKSEGRPGFYALIGSRNSKRLTTTLLTSVLEGRTPYREGAALLNIRPGYLRGIVSHQSTK